MDERQRKTLTSKLSALLGFEDGADDVLAHLLSIQPQDVSLELDCCLRLPLCLLVAAGMILLPRGDIQ